MIFATENAYTIFQDRIWDQDESGLWSSRIVTTADSALRKDVARKLLNPDAQQVTEETVDITHPM